MKQYSLVFLLSMLLVTSVHAAGDLTFHGYLVRPPTCVISNDQTIEVNFVDVQIDEIDGNKFMQDLPYTIDCDSPDRYSDLGMTLTLTGNVTDFNTAAIVTDVSGLGIEILHDSIPFQLGSTLTVNEQALPVLKAVPVKKSGVVMYSGNFEGWATLQVDYQ